MPRAHRRRDDQNAPTHGEGSVPGRRATPPGTTRPDLAGTATPCLLKRSGPARTRHPTVWLVGVRDLQFRRRRFMIAVLATSVVFAMTLIMAGMSNGPRRRDRPARRLVQGRLLGRGTRGVGPVHRDQVRGRRRRRSGAERAGVRGRVTDDHRAGDDRHRRPDQREPARHGRRASAHRRSRRAAPPKRSGEIVVDSNLDDDIGDRGRDQRHAGTRRRQGERHPLQLRRPHRVHHARGRARTSRSPGSLSPAR